MQVFKNKTFARWAAKEGLADATLLIAVDEILRGLVDADLGGHIVKKRVALRGRGKSGSTRTLLAYQQDDKAFFIYGFAKNVRTNISDKELKALQRYAAELLSYSRIELDKAMQAGALIKVSHHE